MDCNIKRVSNGRIVANREQLCTVTSKRQAIKKIAANREQLWTTALKERPMEGLQLIKSEQQKDCNRLKLVSKGKIASSKVKYGQSCMHCI